MLGGSLQDKCLQAELSIALTLESMRCLELLGLCKPRCHWPLTIELAWFLCVSVTQCEEGTMLNVSASNRRFRFAKSPFQ